MTALENYWRVSPRSLLFHACPEPNACKGASAGAVRAASVGAANGTSEGEAATSDSSGGVWTANSSAFIEEEGCADGLAGPMCTVCADGWGMFAGACQSCASVSLSAVAALVSFVALTAVAGFVHVMLCMCLHHAM